MASDRRCYYLVGSSGFPNYGDELIAAQWLRHLAKTDPDADVWLDCHSPGPAQMLLGDEHPRVRFTDTLWRLCWEAPSDEPWTVANWVQHAVHDPGRAPRWVAGIELAARADVVHLLGGGYINAIWPRHVGLIAAAVAATRRSRGRAVLTGHGLLPAPPESAPLVRTLLERFDVIDVRDTPSAELLAGVPNVEQSCDDSLLGFQPGRRADGREPRYVICVQGDVGEQSGWPRLAGQLLATLRSWGARGQQVGVVESIPRVDREVFALIEHELPGAHFFSFSDIWHNGLPIAAQQTWISTRFHPHLLAAAAGARGVALSVRPGYYDVKHASLVELGSGWTLHAADDASPAAEPQSGGFSEEVLQRCCEQKQRIAEKIYPKPKPATAAPAAGTPAAAAARPAERPTTERPAGEVKVITPRNL